MLNKFRKLYYKLINVESKPNFLGYGINQYGKLMPIFRSEIRHVEPFLKILKIVYLNMMAA